MPGRRRVRFNAGELRYSPGLALERWQVWTRRLPPSDWDGITEKHRAVWTFTGENFPRWLKPHAKRGRVRVRRKDVAKRELGQHVWQRQAKEMYERHREKKEKTEPRRKREPGAKTDLPSTKHLCDLCEHHRRAHDTAGCSVGGCECKAPHRHGLRVEEAREWEKRHRASRAIGKRVLPNGGASCECGHKAEAHDGYGCVVCQCLAISGEKRTVEVERHLRVVKDVDALLEREAERARLRMQLMGPKR